MEAATKVKGNPKEDTTMMDEDDGEAAIDHSLYPPLDGNELYNKWKANRAALPTDFQQLLDPDIDEKRRGDLFETEDETTMEAYAWAIPDERALRICGHFEPLVEMGAGAGYWVRLLRDRGVTIGAYDKDVGDDCKAAGVAAKAFTKIDKGGPEMLALCPNATLLLIYPDDYEQAENNGEEENLTLSMASLQNYQGDTVIHVGEWLGSTLTLSMEGQETPDNVYPWGRSTSPDFQIVMEASFHRVLQVPLPNWGSVRNCLTVWKRTTSVVLEGDRYAYIPEDERLNMTVASPLTQHLLKDP